ncbi:MAG: KH domain-containing protein [Oligosphaeraceae bacterium]|nr:KH domain-containing protein [Oligosphaeraceae bacterium]
MGISFLRKIFGSSAEDVVPVSESPSAPVSVPEPELDSSDLEDEAVEPEQSVSLDRLESFVLYVVQSLVDEPEQVRVNSVDKDHQTVIQITCVKKDIGKVIGKSGKTISALRSLVSGAAGRVGQRIMVDVLD